jgi:uncharacterized membrane protein YoaK (UPF0700 family)
MRRFLIFGLLGPAATYLSIDLATRTAARWWWPQPSIYVVVLVPFLLTAFIDRALKDGQAWERLIVAGISAFLASGLVCALVYQVLGFSDFTRRSLQLHARCWQRRRTLRRVLRLSDAPS